MTPDPQIVVANLTKTYRVPERPAGLRAAMRSLARRRYRDVPAVRAISFTIEAGELVGFIGPNGAGKTTTLKMLAGLLQPSAGSARVNGFTPGDRRPAYLSQISMVLGNKSQLLWDIPPLDTFHILAEIYQVAPRQREQTIAELVDLLDMADLLHKPVRGLSLGERMKCELVAALLHRPQILFLDEPTLGLDVSMQRRLRQFIAAYNRRTGATVILTSHYMADVSALCTRVLLIQEGSLLFDGALADLSRRLAPFKIIKLALRDPNEAAVVATLLPQGAELLPAPTGTIMLRVPRAATAAFTGRLLNQLAIADLAVEDPPIEAVIDQIYSGAAGEAL